MLSLATNPACLLMDDELNVLPTSSHVRTSQSRIIASAEALTSHTLMRSRHSRPLLHVTRTVSSAGAGHPAAAAR